MVRIMQPRSYKRGCKREEAAHLADFVDGAPASAVRSASATLPSRRAFQVVEAEFELAPAELLGEQIAGDVFGEHLATGTTALEASSAISDGGSLTSPASPASSRQLEALDHHQQEFLPLDAQVGVGAAAKRSTSGFCSQLSSGTRPCLRSRLPPAMRRSCCSGVAGSATAHTAPPSWRRAPKRSGWRRESGLPLECDLQRPSRTECGARIQAQIHQLVVQQRIMSARGRDANALRDCA